MPDEVLIAGAGPVGLSLALGLARQGIPVRVFEAQPELSREARASTFHPPTLEMLDEWGAAQAIIAQGLRVDALQYWERATRERIAHFDYAHIAGDTPFPFRLQCPQSILTRTLLPMLQATGCARVHFNHRVTGFEDHGDHVSVHVESPEGTRAFCGAYLCGADGAHSVVRRRLGLRFEGMTYSDRFLLISTDYDFGRIFPGIGPVAYIFDPAEWVILMRQREGLRVIFRVPEGEREEEALRSEAIRARLARLLDPFPPEAAPVFGASIYSVHRRIAETFRVGRVLLLGDAAHINNPTGGMGMNSGIHDAHNLADKLARVMRGAPESLLTAYAEERRAAALALVQMRSDQNARDMNAEDPDYRAERNRRLRDAAADPARARAFLLRASMMDDRVGEGT
ncbi:MAG: pentachlorophenol monooxygenase [Candidatus Roseilinea sp.]|nr:MAG: pentachlorophenol monooxygenase [Candidatus Roseilinea sp.]